MTDLPDLSALPGRITARAAELETQAAQIRQRAELEVAALLTAAHELRAVLAPPAVEPAPTARATTEVA